MTNNSQFSCADPKGTLYAIPIGTLLVLGCIAIIDYISFLPDIVDGVASLEWIRSILGVMSSNLSINADISWLYLVIIVPSFVVGMIATKWYKALLAALLIPIISGAIYSAWGLSYGEGMSLDAFFVNPVMFSPFYIVPAVASAAILAGVLSKKTSSRNIISGIR